MTCHLNVLAILVVLQVLMTRASKTVTVPLVAATNRQCNQLPAFCVKHLWNVWACCCFFVLLCPRISLTCYNYSRHSYIILLSLLSHFPLVCLVVVKCHQSIALRKLCILYPCMPASLLVLFFRIPGTAALCLFRTRT